MREEGCQKKMRGGLGEWIFLQGFKIRIRSIRYIRMPARTYQSVSRVSKI